MVGLVQIFGVVMLWSLLHEVYRGMGQTHNHFQVTGIKIPLAPNGGVATCVRVTTAA